MVILEIEMALDKNCGDGLFHADNLVYLIRPIEFRLKD
jgi:hypothetical protein